MIDNEIGDCYENWLSLFKKKLRLLKNISNHKNLRLLFISENGLS